VLIYNRFAPEKEEDSLYLACCGVSERLLRTGLLSPAMIFLEFWTLDFRSCSSFSPLTGPLCLKIRFKNLAHNPAIDQDDVLDSTGLMPCFRVTATELSHWITRASIASPKQIAFATQF